MNENKQDIERRQRLQEWFKSDPEIWSDITAELGNTHHNEMIQLKSRTGVNKEWSAGYINAIDFVLDMGRYFRKQWTEPTQAHQQK